jgi:pimeloyl-ACP methyl ester carboxylesterase
MPARGVVVLAHPLASDKRAFDRPGPASIAPLLAARGWRAVAFDFRGHGESKARPRAGRCDVDHLALCDLPAVCDFARHGAGADGLPIVVVGLGLGGLAALASAGTAAIDVDALVALRSAAWLLPLESSHARRLAQLAVVEGFALAARSRGLRLGARRAFGLTEGARAIALDALRFARTGRWESADGRRDYLASLASITAPVLGVAVSGDFACSLERAGALVARCGGRGELLRVPRAAGSNLVAGRRAVRAWGAIASWMATAARLSRRSAPSERSSPG